MFWNGNFIEGKETTSILKDENVTLPKLLEAEDILQECRSQNKALSKFLSQPEILAELISLIIVEPDKCNPLQEQYRNAALASEILTSNIPELREKLSSDVVQLGRICDFLNQEPPLNPLLASYFSKTVEMLFQREPIQDWCSNQIICLRVLDFLQSRKDFLPNLFRHIGTSAIMDTFKYFIQIDSLSENILLWFEEYQFVETLIQIVCGTYSFQEERSFAEGNESADESFKTEIKAEINEDQILEAAAQSGEEKEELLVNGEEATESSEKMESTNVIDEPADLLDLSKLYTKERLAGRIASDRSHNATALICDLLCWGCTSEDPKWPGTGFQLVRWCTSEAAVSLLLTSMFTAPQQTRRDAVVNGILIIFTMLKEVDVNGYNNEETMANTVRQYRDSVVNALALHLPLLHQVLLEPHQGGNNIVGPLRVQTARLISLLASVESSEVSGALIALGTFGVLLDLFFRYTDNNFLHTGVYIAIMRALSNTVHKEVYANHIIIECDLLNKIVDAWEENEERKKKREPRCGYTGRLLQLVKVLGEERELLGGVPADTLQRFITLYDSLQTLIHRTNESLGGMDPYEESSEKDLSEPLNMGDYNYEDLGKGIAEDESISNYTEIYNYSTANFLKRNIQWGDEEEADTGLQLTTDATNPPSGILQGDQPWGSSKEMISEEGWANFNDKSVFWDYPQQSAEDSGTVVEEDPFAASNILYWNSGKTAFLNYSMEAETEKALDELQTAASSSSSDITKQIQNIDFSDQNEAKRDFNNEQNFIKNVVSLTNIVNNEEKSLSEEKNTNESSITNVDQLTKDVMIDDKINEVASRNQVTIKEAATSNEDKIKEISTNNEDKIKEVSTSNEDKIKEVATSNEDKIKEVANSNEDKIPNVAIKIDAKGTTEMKIASAEASNRVNNDEETVIEECDIEKNIDNLPDVSVTADEAKSVVEDTIASAANLLESMQISQPDTTKK